MSQPKPISWYARRYVERFGMQLVPIEPRRKFPTTDDWGANTLQTPDDAQGFYERNPAWNMGVALGQSGFCSLDIDCMESFATICECFGIDLDALLADAPTIQGAAKGRRLMFRVPAGADLPYCKLNWPRQDDASKLYTVFELRSATDGKARQDVLPPSIHPDTGHPYRWLVQPRDDWPEPPRWLLAMWQAWADFKPQMQAMCPWAPVAQQQPRQQQVKPRAHEGGSVIEAYCQAADLEAELHRYGYKKCGRRWLSPHSTTGLPGVALFEDGASCWIHHASDPLCSESSGQPVNAFDLFCYYDHNGDASKAAKAAADLLGMTPQRAMAQQVAKHDSAGQGTAPAPVADQAPAGAVATVPALQLQAVSRASYNLEDPLPFCTDKGKPINHVENVAEICRRIGVHIRYDMIGKREQILIPGMAFSRDNEDNASYAWLESEMSLFDMPTSKLGGYLTYIGDRHQYNPVVAWVDSRPWDGQSRLQAWYDTVRGMYDHEPERKALKETLMRRWAVSAIASAYSPDGVSSAGVLVFQGAQYIGKTQWFKRLVPSELGVLSDGATLRLDDKDSIKHAVSHWLVELGEIDSTFKKSDIAALKAFLTKKEDSLRLPFARRESNFPRRTVFFGSVNQHQYLHDPTGNRRFWTIEVDTLDLHHTIDMQQFWAEVLHLWRDGEGYYLTQSELQALNDCNEEYTVSDPVEELLLTRLDWSASHVMWRWVTSTDLLHDIGVDRPTRSDCTAVGVAMRRQDGVVCKRSAGKNLLFAPPRLPRYPA